jgi:hypothetical protein
MAFCIWCKKILSWAWYCSPSCREKEEARQAQFREIERLAREPARGLWGEPIA